MLYDVQTVTVLQLYRVRLFSAPLFPLDGERPKILANSIYEKPSLLPEKGTRLTVSRWHIGNVVAVDDMGIAFAVGKQSPTNKSKYDESTGDFYLDLDFDAPFSVAIIDTKLGVLAVAPKKGLSNTDSVARKISEMLSITESVTSVQATVAIDPIYDSETFLKLVNSAYLVHRFIFDFYPPNPDDPEMEIQKEAEDWAQRVNAKHGRLSVDGNNLNKQEVSRVSRGVINSGAEAIAVVRNSPTSRSRRISSKTQVVATELDYLSLDSRESLIAALDSIRDAYRENRGEI